MRRARRPASLVASLTLLAAGAAACPTEDAGGEPGSASPRCAPLDGPDDVARAIVFQSGEDGYPTYRIPALVTTASGVLLAFAEGRPSVEDPGSGEIDVVMKRSEDCGRTWGPLEVLADNGAGDAHNPVALVGTDADGHDAVWLFFSERPASDGGEFDLPVGLGPDSASVWVRKSLDDGATWSAARDITSSVKDPAWAITSPGPGRGLQKRWAPAAGRLVVPAWYTTADGTRGSFVFISDDGGETFARGGVPAPGTDECQVVETTDGAVDLDTRQHTLGGGATRQVFTSEDGGETWSAPRDGLRMPPVMSSVLRIQAARDGDARDLLLHSGNSEVPRTDLHLWRSEDEGRTWSAPFTFASGLIQYSVLTRFDDGSLGVIYEAADASGLFMQHARFLLERVAPEG